MRTYYRWLLLSLFVVVNGFILFWVWRSSTDNAPEVAPTKEERQRASSEAFGRTDSLAYDLIGKWNRDPVVDLRSEDLDTHVQSLPEADCIGLPVGAKAIDSASLPPSVKQDFGTAVTGLLRAYREGKPDSLIKYMRERGKIVNRDFRKFLERGLVKRGASEPEKLNDDELYSAAWTAFKSNAHWSGLVVNSSCRQFWDGKTVPLRNLLFDINSLPDTPPGQLEQAAFLMRLLHGNSSSRHGFISETGSVEIAHKDDPKVLLCDVLLIVELDESYSHVNAPYLFRFWFNPHLKKWQPFAKMGFSTDPHKLALPSTMF